ncbi:MAG: HU family DNA-binding protein [Deltaproteobacteria bacterium]|nr:HU family DNA-binding protein [Deltaproteobacteria bacterium]
MTLNKSDIVNRVRETVRFKRRHKDPQLFLFPELDCTFLSRKRSAEIVNTLFETIKVALAKGEDVRMVRFGTFQVKFKWARKGRNPRTGESLILKSTRTVRFKASKKLRDKMNTPHS